MFDQLCRMQCTKQEIAGFFHVSEDTIDRRVREITGESFAVLHGELACGGKTSLRRAQWKSAIGDKKRDGSISMQIWLGKQMLGQSDKTESKNEERIAFEFKSNPKRPT